MLCCLLTASDAPAISMLSLCSFHSYRKFADIEASNQRLASALYQTVEKNSSSQEPDTTDQFHKGAASGISMSKSATSKSNDARVEQKEASKTHKPEELITVEPSVTTERGRGSHGDSGEDPTDEHPPRSSNAPSAQPQPTNQDSVDCDHQMDVSSTFPPELHLLSLDYCNFPDILEKPELLGDKSESQWADIVDLFGIGSNSSNKMADFFDIEAYFKSICSSKSDSSEQTVDGQSAEWSSDQWEETCTNARQDEEDVELTVTPEGVCGGTTSHPQMDGQACFIQSQQPTAVTHNSTQRSTRLDSETSCTLMANQHSNFEGVAQSFSVSPHIQRCSIPTPPPHEDDWLFTYILKDRASSDFWQ